MQGITTSSPSATYEDPSLFASAAIAAAATKPYNKRDDKKWRSRSRNTASGSHRSMKMNHRKGSLVANYMLMQKVLLSQSEILRTLTNLTSRMVPTASTNILNSTLKKDKKPTAPVPPPKITLPPPKITLPPPPQKPAEEAAEEPAEETPYGESYGQEGGRTRVKKRKVNRRTQRKKRVQRR